MQRYSLAAGLALAALAVLGLVGPVAAGEQVPFRGRLAGVESSQLVSVSPPIVEVMAEAAGTASHLGKFTLAIHDFVNTGMDALFIGPFLTEKAASQASD